MEINFLGFPGNRGRQATCQTPTLSHLIDARWVQRLNNLLGPVYLGVGGEQRLTSHTSFSVLLMPGGGGDSASCWSPVTLGWGRHGERGTEA